MFAVCGKNILPARMERICFFRDRNIRPLMFSHDTRIPDPPRNDTMRGVVSDPSQNNLPAPEYPRHTTDKCVWSFSPNPSLFIPFPPAPHQEYPFPEICKYASHCFSPMYHLKKGHVVFSSQIKHRLFLNEQRMDRKNALIGIITKSSLQ